MGTQSYPAKERLFKTVITYHQIYMYVPTLIYMLDLNYNFLEVNCLPPPPFTITTKDLFSKEI